jgi:hypothetical protein
MWPMIQRSKMNYNVSKQNYNVKDISKKVHHEFKVTKKVIDTIRLTYMLGTNGVIFTFGCTTSPIAKIPPPFMVSKQ